MDAFKLVAIVPMDKLSMFLKQFEKHQIPYNVELSKEKIQTAPRNGTVKQAILNVLTNGPMKTNAIGKAIESDGYSFKSVAGAVHLLKKSKLIKTTPNGYVLTGKAAK